MTRIGNTAEYGTSGLDERQAAGLLSAVGEAGLLLVEPGHTPDPVAAGLNTAINRARLAWERSQPQLVIDGWLDMLDELDEPQPSALRFVEPVCKAAPPIAGGLTSRLTAGEVFLPGVASTDVTTGPDAGVPARMSGRPSSPAVSRVLNPGAEPCCGTHEELTAVVPAAADTARPVPSAPSQHDGAGRMSLSDVRGRRQRGV